MNILANIRSKLSNLLDKLTKHTPSIYNDKRQHDNRKQEQSKLKHLTTSINLIGGFISGLLGASLFFIFAFPVVNKIKEENLILNQTTGSDVIATANTYIVFTSFIFILITILLSLLGIWFTKWLATSKERELHDSMDYFFNQIQKDHDFAHNFLTRLLDNRKIKEIFDLHMTLMVKEKVKQELQNRSREDDSLDEADDLLFSKIDNSEASDE